MKQIVVIEDDEILLKSLGYFIKSNGYGIQEFGNGEDAIAFIQSNAANIDLVITDLNMPFASGKEVVMACRAFSNIRLIVLTSQSIDENELELLDMGADEFIKKPFNPQVLLKRIEKLI